MQLTIEYEYGPGVPECPYIAHTRISGTRVNGFGSTWERAKKNLLAKVQAYLQQVEVPAPETVDWDV